MSTQPTDRSYLQLTKMSIGAGASPRSLLLRFFPCEGGGGVGGAKQSQFRVGGPLPFQVTQCIIRDGPLPFGSRLPQANRISVTYSNVLGGYPGEGNLDADPCFVDPGYWANPDDLTKEAVPIVVLGPVLLAALRRFAAILASLVMGMVS